MFKKFLVAQMIALALVMISVPQFAWSVDGTQGDNGPAMLDITTNQVFDSQTPPTTRIVQMPNRTAAYTHTAHGTVTETINASDILPSGPVNYFAKWTTTDTSTATATASSTTLGGGTLYEATNLLVRQYLGNHVLQLQSYGTSGRSNIAFYKSRGTTLGALATTLDGDILGEIDFGGTVSTGLYFGVGGWIRATQVGAATATSTPAKLELTVKDFTGNNNTVLSLNPDKTAVFLDKVLAENKIICGVGVSCTGVTATGTATATTTATSVRPLAAIPMTLSVAPPVVVLPNATKTLSATSTITGTDIATATPMASVVPLAGTSTASSTATTWGLNAWVTHATGDLSQPSGVCASGYVLTSTVTGQTSCVAMPSAYTLPIAGTTTATGTNTSVLGGLKAGPGFVEAVDGTLSVTPASVGAPTGTGTLTGTTSYLPKKTASGWGDSSIRDNGTSVTIGSGSPPGYLLAVSPSSGPATISASTPDATQYGAAFIGSENLARYFQLASWGASAAGSRFGLALAGANELVAFGTTTRFLIGTDNASPVVFGVSGAARFTLNTDGTNTLLGGLRLSGSTSGAVTIQPAAAAGTWTLTLPTTGGTSGYVLQTDGSGTTTWSAPSIYTLPIATGSVLGGVKCGAGITCAGDGTASVSTSYLAPNAVSCSGTTKVNATNGQITSCTAATYADVGADPSGAASSAVATAINGTSGKLAVFSGTNSVGSSTCSAASGNISCGTAANAVLTAQGGTSQWTCGQMSDHPAYAACSAASTVSSSNYIIGQTPTVGTVLNDPNGHAVYLKVSNANGCSMDVSGNWSCNGALSGSNVTYTPASTTIPLADSSGQISPSYIPAAQDMSFTGSKFPMMNNTRGVNPFITNFKAYSTTGVNSSGSNFTFAMGLGTVTQNTIYLVWYSANFNNPSGIALDIIAKLFDSSGASVAMSLSQQSTPAGYNTHLSGFGKVTVGISGSVSLYFASNVPANNAHFISGSMIAEQVAP